MDLTCLHHAWISTSDLLVDFGGDEWAGLYLLGFLLAVVLAPLVLWRYQKRVVQLMAVSGTSPTPNVPDDGISINQADLCPEHSRMQGESSAGAFMEESKKRSFALQRTLALSVGIFAVVVALILTVSPDSISEDAAISAPEWIASAVVYQLFVASLCLPLVLLSYPRATFQRLFIRLCVPLYFVTVALAVGLDDATGLEEKLLDFTVAAFMLLVLYAGIGGRSARNVVPLVTLLICLMWPVMILASAGMNLADACLDGIENDYFFLAGLFLVVGPIWLIARLPFGVLSLLTRAYERQAFSDAQFQMGAWLILIALFFAFAAGPDEYGLNRWSLGVLVAALLGLGMYRYRLAAIKPWQPTRRLLLLRVFASDRRGERLLDDVAFYWRFLGPIWLVGGPDLAKANLDPHELLLFLRRRLASLFISDHKRLTSRLEKLDVRTDPDGRYRIEEFFCFDEVWQQAVDGLLERCDQVLLDLRGFNAERRGTAFEVQLLARRQAFDRTLILTDDHTDMEAVRQAVTEVGGSLPPACLLYVNASVDGEVILKRLLDVG